MRIGINERYEIKQVDEITDASLSILEVPDDTFPSDWDLETLLKYCYKVEGDTVSIYPFKPIVAKEVDGH